MSEPIPHPPIAAYDDWRRARVELLAEEKALTKQMDAVNAKRRRLPMVKVEKPYVFQTTEGEKTLAELFKGQTQLVIYHFMFDPEWDEGCDGCTGFVDALGSLADLHDRNTEFVLVSRAPLEKLLALAKAKGWQVPWVSSFGSDFNYDFHTTLDANRVPIEYNFRTAEELAARGKNLSDYTGETHGMSVFFRLGNDVYLTYQTFARGVEARTDLYPILDMTPYGRQEKFEDSPAGFPQRETYGV